MNEKLPTKNELTNLINILLVGESELAGRDVAVEIDDNFYNAYCQNPTPITRNKLYGGLDNLYGLSLPIKYDVLYSPQTRKFLLKKK